MKKIIIAADRSGSGKTTITMALLAALKKRGLKVRPYKVGPDYIDGIYHKIVSDEYSYNLDSWMLNKDYLVKHFDETSSGYDMALIEGVMGLFDGKGEGIQGSTAEISIILGVPVILIVDCKAIAGSIAPLVYGFMNFDSRVKVAGVILNNISGPKHKEYLISALKNAGISYYGAVYRNELFNFKSRHLGLDTSIEKNFNENKIHEMAETIEKSLNIEKILEVATFRTEKIENKKELEPYNIKIVTDIHRGNRVKCRLAIAYDEAFHFYYRANLDLLKNCGAELVKFSPLNDKDLPENLGGIYLGGGYPEVYADKLSRNKKMIDAVRKFAFKGGVIYGECGGLMYLGRSIIYNGKKHSMVGIFDIDFEICGKLFHLGYVELQLLRDCILGEKGTIIRGHEYHYSKIINNDDNNKKWKKGIYYTINKDDNNLVKGFYYKKVLASYVHLHFGSNPKVACNLVESCYNFLKKNNFSGQ